MFPDGWSGTVRYYAMNACLFKSGKPACHLAVSAAVWPCQNIKPVSVLPDEKTPVAASKFL